MMTVTKRLAADRQALFAEIEAFVASHDSAQSGLLREQLGQLRAQSESLVAAPLCLSLSRALGLSEAEGLQVAVIVGFVELAALSLKELPPTDGASAPGLVRKHGLPLVLNACDGLFALAHVGLTEFEAQEGGRRRGAAARFDAVSLTLWERALSQAEPAYFGDWGAVQAAAGRLAGELPAQILRREEPDVVIFGDIGESVVLALAARSAPQLPLDLATARLTAKERSALQALLEPLLGDSP